MTIQHTQQGLFQYLSTSANKMFGKKTTFVPPYQDAYIDNPYDTPILNKSTSDITLSSSYSEKSILSMDEDEEDDRFVLTPSSSSSILSAYQNTRIQDQGANNGFLDCGTMLCSPIDKEDQPWRLDLHANSAFNYSNQQNDYFFIDRDAKADESLLDIGRDSYGFKRPTQWIKMRHLRQFDHYHQPILSKQQQAWQAMLSRCNGELPSASYSTLKSIIRKGVPSNLRGRVWMHYSGASKKMEANPDVYSSLVKTAIKMGEYNEHAEVIQRDLHRTFPDNSNFECAYFVDPEGATVMEPETNSKLQSLRRILLAFSIYSPQIGYCQSLNYLVGLFLLFVNTEEEAFWLLVTTVNDYMPEKMYDPTMEGVNIDQSVLMMMIYEKIPSIWDKISNEGKCFWENNQQEELPHMTLVTSHWFLTMFINILPIETVLRIWDCFFFEGHTVLFQAALTIIQMNQERISMIKDPIEIFQILQNMPKRLIDCHSFMDHVFSPPNLFSTINPSDISIKREYFNDRLRQHCQSKKRF